MSNALTNAARQARHREKLRREREAIDTELAALRAEVIKLKTELARERNRRKPTKSKKIKS